MKKIIYLMLIVLILPIACLGLVGCKDKNKNLGEFYNSYLDLANQSTHLTLAPITETNGIATNSNKVALNYASSSQLEERIHSSGSKYSHLDSLYKTLLDNTLSPLYFYTPKLIDSGKVSKSQTKDLYGLLNEFKEDYLDLAYYYGILCTSIQSGNTEQSNLSHLRTVFEEYEDTIESASKLSSYISNVYFNTVLDNGNPSYSSPLDENSISAIIANTRTRVYFYKSMYADVYYHIYIDGADLSETITSQSSVTIPTYPAYEYIKNIDLSNPTSMNILLANENLIYKRASSLYSIQTQLDLNYKLFETAKNNITYSKITHKSSADEQAYASTMTQFANNIALSSYEILEDLIRVLYTI